MDTQNQLNPSSVISVLQWNCNGIIKHQNELRNHLCRNSNKYDIICLQETFLKPDKKFNIPGYTAVRRDRVDGDKGGVLTLVKQNLNYTQICSPDNLECIVLKIKLLSAYLTVANIYLPPDKYVDQNELSKIFGPQTLIIGDINAKSKLWGSPRPDERGLMFEELIDMHNASVINTGQPTYQHHNGSLSHLDVSIVSSALATRSNWSVLNNTMGSDHCPTVVTINDTQPFVEQGNPPRFKLSKADWSHYKRICNESLTAQATYDDDIAIHSRRVTEVIIAAAERCVPQSKPGRKKLKHKPLPYWNENCNAAIYARNRARNKLNRNNTPENAENYKKLKGTAQKTIKEAASDYWKDFCDTLNRTTNLSVVWNMAKRMNGISVHKKPQNFELNGKLIETDLEKANAFAESFAKTSSNDNYSTTFKIYKQQIENESAEKSLHRKPTGVTTSITSSSGGLDDNFSLSELRRAVRETKKHSAPGDDRISYSMIQHLSKRSTRILLDLYNRVWTEGQIPQDWRHAIITPILKPGKDPQDISSYRPISLTSAVGKVMEKLVTNRLTYYLEKNKMLTNVQTGFRKGRSTVDQIIRLQDTINKYNHNKGYTMAVFIDFKSAYDMLWHNGLLRKLKNMGIDGKTFAYISHFLNNRTIQVRVGDKLSTTHVLENGTPQGSIISPLLFLIMINDLPTDLTDTETTLFADDSCLFKSGRNLDVIIRRMQNSLNKLADWCDINGFKISMDKTVAVLFTHRREQINKILKINDEALTVKSHAKFLGIIFDSKLTWNDHVNYIVDKCKKRINLLRAVAGNKWGANKNTLLRIYRSVIRSVIDYGAIALDSMSECNKKRLDCIQTQALRIASGAARCTANAALQVDMGEPPLQLRRLQQQLQYAAKVQCTENHPARQVFEPHWTIRSKKYNMDTDPIYCKVKEFMSQQDTKNWEGPITPSYIPWRTKDLAIDISVAKGTNKKECPELITSVAKERIDRSKHDLQVYTDASKTPDGKTSAAFCIPELKFEHSVRLTDKITIFTAEMMAIKQALQWIQENERQIGAHQRNIVLFSDSLSVLQVLKNGKTDCRPNMIAKIFEIVNGIKNSVTLVWIPSHLGIRGNEMADKAAQRAISNQMVNLEVKLELKEIYNMITKYVMNKWQDMYNTSQHGHFYREIEPLVSQRIKYTHQSRSKETTITRIRLGKCYTNEFLARLKVVDSDKCVECVTAVETVEHFLLQCPHSDLCKKIISTCSSLGVPPEIKYILSDNRMLDLIYRNLNRKM